MGIRAVHAPHLASDMDALAAALRSPSEVQLYVWRPWSRKSEPIPLEEACWLASRGYASRLVAEVPT